MTQTQMAHGVPGAAHMSWSSTEHGQPLPHSPGRSTPLHAGNHAHVPTNSLPAPPTRPSSRSPETIHEFPVNIGGGAHHTEDTPAIEPAVQYVQKIKQRCDTETYKQFLDILASYHHKPDMIDEVHFILF